MQYYDNLNIEICMFTRCYYLVFLSIVAYCLKMDLDTVLQTVLPFLHKDQMEKLKQKLLECGVETDDDLRYIKEDDIKDILKPIQMRKLLGAWSSK